MLCKAKSTLTTFFYKTTKFVMYAPLIGVYNIIGCIEEKE